MPVFNNTFHQEIPPDTQPELPLAQLEAVSCHPVTNCLGEEPNPQLATTFSQEFLEQ